MRLDELGRAGLAHVLVAGSEVRELVQDGVDAAFDDAARVRAHLASAGLPTRLGETKVAREDLLPLMRTDKKNDNGRLRLVLARGIGEAFLSDGVEEQLVADFLKGAA